MPVELPEQAFEPASVFTHEEWSDAIDEDRIGVHEVHRVGHAQAFGTIGCARSRTRKLRRLRKSSIDVIFTGVGQCSGFKMAADAAWSIFS